MATALETAAERRTPTPQAALVAASVAGAVYVAAALAVVFYAVPDLWQRFVAPTFAFNSLTNFAVRVGLQLVAAVGLVRLGQSLAGSHPPKGLRGGIFLVISAAVAIFFIVRAVGLTVDGSAGPIITAIVALALAFGAVKFFTSPRAATWMVGLEESGLLHATGYKRSLGQKVRRLTVLGILLIGGSGVYSLYTQGVLPAGDWTLNLPYTTATLTLLTAVRYSVPVLLFGLTLWLAYRIVNVPTFAEFLIATEAEMNKVSWSTRRQLVQDTVVVLVFVVATTLFLLAVDLFWGWLLSAIGVLPEKTPGQAKPGQADVVKW